MYKTAAAWTCVLGINELPQSFLHSECSLWITDKAPSLNHWLQTVTSIIPFELFFQALKDKPFLFHVIWGSWVPRRPED